MNLVDSLRLKEAVTVAVVMVLTLSMLAAVISPIKPAEAQASQLPADQRNWERVNANEFGWNYNPQNQINKDAVGSLELKWIYPVPTVTQQTLQLGGLAVNEGSMAPPLVVDGITYLTLNSRNIVALDAKTGKLLWTYQNQFNNTGLQSRLPLTTERTHQHGINYIDGMLWMNDYGCKLTAIDAKTGKVAKQLTNLCLEIPLDSPQGIGVPTNSGFYAGAAAHPPTYYKAGNMLTWAIGGGAEGTNGGRAFVAGIDASTGKTVWRFFYMPPCADPATCKPTFVKEKQDWGNWLVQNCNKIWIQRIKSCELDQDLLRNDFGNMRFNSGISNVWGTMVVDQDTGILYFGTSQAGPDWNATYAPGFRLFGASVIALNVKTGELVWAHQTTARDLWDFDCSWNTVLANAKIGGQSKKVVIKGCKNGMVHVLDAATGEAYYYLESTDIKRCADVCQFLNPRSKADMTKPWTNYPSKDAFWMNCPAFGCLESDIAYDPTRNIVYAATMNSPQWSKVGNAELRGVSVASAPAGTAPFIPKENATISAWDLNTGQLKWKYFIDGRGFRGGLIVTGGLVWGSAIDGYNRALDADTGKVVYQANIGVSTLVQPTMGADSDGKMKLFRIVGGQSVIFGGAGSLFSQAPGALMVYGLPDTVPQAKEVIKEVPKEVIKEVPKEVIKTVTVETVSPASYAIVGIGVIIAVVGIVMSRRKKA